MNNGDDTAYFLEKGYRIVAIEANPTLVARATERFSGEIASSRLTVLNVGIDVRDQSRDFWVCDGNDEWSSFEHSMASRWGMSSHAVAVTCVRFRTVLQQSGVPYYLKVDIEGHDHLCVLDLDSADLPEFVSLELFFLEDLLALRDLGYNAFKCIDQVDHRQLAFRMPDVKTWLKYQLKDRPRLYALCSQLLQAKRVVTDQFASNARSPAAASDRRFPLGSSGPFGNRRQLADLAAGRSQLAQLPLGIWRSRSKG